MGKRVGGIQDHSGRGGKGKKSASLPGIEPRFLGMQPVVYLLTYLLKLLKCKNKNYLTYVEAVISKEQNTVHKQLCHHELITGFCYLLAIRQKKSVVQTITRNHTSIPLPIKVNKW